ncbi:MAG: hypothetical protein QXP94_05810 [Thermofilaceae archaeon]
MIVLDLRRGAGCTDHPAVKLPSLLSRYAGERELGFLFDPNDLPLEAVKLILARHGYTLSELREAEGGMLILVARRGG